MNKNLENEFAELLESYQNILHKICRIYTVDNDSRKDLFQEMVIQLWRAYPSFRADAKFSTWAYRICLNTAITLFRNSRRRVNTVEYSTLPIQIANDEYDDTHEQKIKSLYEGIHKLNDIEKALVYLYLEDKSFKEIAETMGISEVNARVKMNRTKAKLKLLLSKS